MPKIYVPHLEEFEGLIENARSRDDCTVRALGSAYVVIEGEAPLRIVRRDIRMRPAIWYSTFSGGIEGRLVDFGRDEVTIVDA